VKPSDQFKARGLSGRYVIMGIKEDGSPWPGLATHSLSCYVPHQDRPEQYKYGPVPVEEVPKGSFPCGHCGGGAYRSWIAKER
jgi:hypothetical protein